ncbi:MAG: helix-turn-helix domain-containing protein, partial [Balneolales bacterium]
MAGKPKPMSQIKQLLRLHQQGAGKKHIARTLSISRNTVKAYLEKVTGSGWDVEQLLALEDPVLLQRFH